MINYKLSRHRVKQASFIENSQKEKKNELGVRVEGGILVPKELGSESHVTVNLKFHLGDEDERLYLYLETVSVFELQNENIDLSEEAVQKECLPIALASLRNTVKQVSEAYGLPSLDLPPFEDENVGK